MSTEPRLPATIQSIPEALRFWAERTPDAPALIVPERPAVTYGDLWAAVRTWASRLDRIGIARHDRVLLLVPEGADLAAALLGTMSAAIALPLPDSTTPEELETAIVTSRAAAAIIGDDLSAAARDRLTRRGLTVLAVQDSGARDAFGVVADLAWVPRVRPQEIAFAVKTSGTTGEPKWVPTEHGRVVQDGRTHRDRFGLDRDDRALAVAPLSLSLGMCVLTHGIAAGSALIFPNTVDMTGIWRAIETARPTWMFPSSGFVELLAQFLRARPHLAAPESLRLVRVTAAPISPATCEELATRLGAPVLFSYSSSEAGLIATALPPPARYKPGSSGKPIQELRVVDDADQDVATGDEGEIWVRGPKVFPGYLDDPETNAAVLLPDGWFRTGDMGYLDGDGFLYVTGRRGEFINRGGAKVAPAEIDNVLLAHPAAADAAAFALPDARLGEDIGAAIVLETGRTVTARELRDWMLDRLSAHKVPRRIWFVDDLPRTASGKVRREALTRRFSRQTKTRAHAASPEQS